MPTPKNRNVSREYIDKNRKKSSRASSFHGRTSMMAAEETTKQLMRPRTLPDLSFERIGFGEMSRFQSEPRVGQQRPRLAKLLLNVTMRGSVGAVQVILSPESTVEDLISAAVMQYTKERRRPALATADPSGFNLHFSQFSLESIDRDEKLVELGTRNFFICPKKSEMASAGTGDGRHFVSASSVGRTCPEEAEFLGASSCFEWLGLMALLL